jgi:hypothetical protein
MKNKNKISKFFRHCMGGIFIKHLNHIFHRILYYLNSIRNLACRVEIPTIYPNSVIFIIALLISNSCALILIITIPIEEAFEVKWFD